LVWAEDWKSLEVGSIPTTDIPSIRTGKRQMKKPIATIRLTLLAHKAAPSSTLGQAFGQYGINIMDFCKQFNNQTKNLKANENQKIPTTIIVFSRNSFEIHIKTPSSTSLLKNCANVSKASMEPKKQELTQYITLKELYHLAIFKKCDPLMNHLSVKSITRSLIGSAKSMGLSLLPQNSDPRSA
jgi:large subunit ribosomal protein L11